MHFSFNIMTYGESNNILVRRKYKPTKIMEELEQKLGGLEPLSSIGLASAATALNEHDYLFNFSSVLLST